NPQDAGADNVYNFTVTATDDGIGTLSDSQDFAITVTDVTEAPVGTSPASGDTVAMSVAEHTTELESVGHTVPGVGQDMTYSLSGGVACLLTSHSKTAVLISSTTPFRSNPQDAGADNVYNFTVTATDDGIGTLSDSQDFAITVTDVPEGGGGSGQASGITFVV